MFSPINEFKLCSKGKELFERLKKMAEFKINKIYLNNAEFDLILKGVTPSMRKDCENVIPFMGKEIVRNN